MTQNRPPDAPPAAFPWRRLGIWTLGFLAFPLAGILGGVVGPVDDPASALVGGAVTGLVLGAGQSAASLGLLRPVRWIPATTVGMAAGLVLGAAAVGYRTTLADLALMGLLTGIPLGVAQAAALPADLRHRIGWAILVPLLWALGWTVTTLVGVDVESGYTIFGSTGAVTVTVLAGLALLPLLRRGTRPTGAAAAQPTATVPWWK
ncbi:hypothetical protein ACFQ34_24510 [Pseudonocardia benzenivorans]|jgi:hypothetical protein|uniref:Uncharacterized protein n=2 Tax=Pseudonocardia TaxID=1847 RepID=A0ABW3VMW9_9PSEU|nr:hypothetical protein PSD17_63500 [Pseudonocardia sp. D17]